MMIGRRDRNLYGTQALFHSSSIRNHIRKKVSRALLLSDGHKAIFDFGDDSSNAGR